MAESPVSTSGKISIPPFLYGTAWKEGGTQRCVEDALSAGFRGIDTANQRRHYFEAGVGAALKKFLAQGTFTRGDLFLQTKFTFIDGQDHRLPYEPDASITDQVNQSFASSLEHLETGYLDSYVLHGPSTGRGLAPADWEAWRAMEELYHAGKAKSIGVSNVNADQLRLLCEQAAIRPAFVQNRCYAQTAWDRSVRDLCREHRAKYQGFSLLTANLHIFDYPAFREILKRTGCTPAQAVFCFARQVGMLPITGTTNPAHMREDLESLEMELGSQDIQTIEELAL